MTTSPGVVAFWRPGRDGEWYAAIGDCWIGRDGERGQYLYGRRGVLLTVVEVRS